MFLSDLSIKRPIFASVMMLALVTLGAFSYKRLAIDMFPDVEIPVVTIVTKFPGASRRVSSGRSASGSRRRSTRSRGEESHLDFRESVSTVMVSSSSR